MTSRTYANKRTALNGVLEHVEADGFVDVTAQLPEAFTDIEDLLLTAHQRWQRHLGARIDAALESGDEPSIAVAHAYRETTRFMPALRRLLDRYETHPVLRAGVERELAMLAWAAGLVSYGAPQRQAAARGRQFRDTISATTHTRATRQRARGTRGWWHRLTDVAAVSR